MLVQKDTYLESRKHLKDLTDEELKTYFWELAERIVDPLVDLAYKNTSPSIERSVLMRMGFSSIEAIGIVSKVMEKGLMGKGCGHVVYALSQKGMISIKEAGIHLMNDEGFDLVFDYFKERKNATE